MSGVDQFIADWAREHGHWPDPATKVLIEEDERYEPAELPVAELDEEEQARRRMLAAGVKPPHACECEHPAVTEDLDGERTCVKCGRSEP